MKKFLLQMMIMLLVVTGAVAVESFFGKVMVYGIAYLAFDTFFQLKR